MAVWRKAPKCTRCGEEIKGKYWEPEVFFCGDTFIGWDYAGHVCRLGKRYFIERMDTREWWTGLKYLEWTVDPTVAMVFVERKEAEKYLAENLRIAPRIECTVTEHEFVGKEKVKK